MKKTIFLLLFDFLFLSFNLSYSQGVGVNTNGAAADPSAILDASSTEQGTLIPRMTKSQRDALSSPVESLLIFNTNTQCFEAYNGAISQWVRIACLNSVDACGGAKTITDTRDNQTYSVKAYGTQCWMTQNLDYGTYTFAHTGWQSPGTKFCPNIKSQSDPTCPMGGVYDFPNMMNGAKSVNGTCTSPDGLCDNPGDRQSAAVPVKGLCPIGWHIPTHYEWNQLEQYICNENPSGANCIQNFPYDTITFNVFKGTTEGGKMKTTIVCDTGTCCVPSNCWFTPNTGANNSSGFSVMPAGYSFTQIFVNTSREGYFASCSETSGKEWYRSFYWDSAAIHRNIYPIAYLNNPTGYGFSVRCIKDQ